MAQISVEVNGRMYTIACQDGEEEHIRDLLDYVRGKVDSLVEQLGQLGEGRLLLMAALTVADELSETVDKLEAVQQGPVPAAPEDGAVLEQLAGRIDAVAAQLESA